MENSNRKYELVKDDTIKTFDGRTMFRIRAIVAMDAIGVAAGDLGGYIEAEKNLSQVFGDARVYARNHLGWMSCVGSENGTLCWFLERDRTVRVNRGCFSGSLEEFRSAVEETHGDSPNGQQYRLIIQYIELRSEEVLKGYVPEPSELEA